MAQLHAKHRGLQRVEAAVAAHHVVAVLNFLAVVGHHTDLLGQSGVAGEHCAPVAHASEVFGRKKARAPDGPEGSEGEGAAVAKGVAGTEGLGGVFDHGDSALVRQRQQRVHVSALPVQVHRHNGLGLRRDGCTNLVEVECEGVGVDIYEDGRESEQCNHLSCSYVCKRCGNHFVARLQAEGHEGDLQRVGSVGARDRMHALAEVGAELARECGHVGPLDVGGLVARADQSLVEFGLDARVLSDEVNHRNRRVKRQVLGHKPQR